MTARPDFHSRDFLEAEIRHTMAFYHPHCLDPAGGCFHDYRDDGSLGDRQQRHLVSSARFVFDYAMYFRQFGGDEYRDGLVHCLRFLRDVHRDPDNGGYCWIVADGRPLDATNRCYGVAFVLLAYAHALMAGIDPASGWLDETWDLLEQRYFEPSFGLYRDEADAAWQFTDYRGQNANMHMCEAMLAAFDATGHTRYLDRAVTLADNITRRQAALADGLVWEHYDHNWQVDWDYNRERPDDLFRPWGFQPGHQTEWAKLLLMIAERRALPWLEPTARHLFDTAMERGWDGEFGGLYYGFAPDGAICAPDKYHWVQAESLACAARLARCTGDTVYAAWYRRLWAYVWDYFIDHEHGDWYRVLTREGRRLDDHKSPPGKTGYHNMGACYDVLAGLNGGC